MCAEDNSTPSRDETQSNGALAQAQALERALRREGFWPTSPLAWPVDGVRNWVDEEMQLMTPEHRNTLLLVVTGLRLLELHDRVEYVAGVLKEVNGE